MGGKYVCISKLERKIRTTLIYRANRSGRSVSTRMQSGHLLCVFFLLLFFSFFFLFFSQPEVFPNHKGLVKTFIDENLPLLIAFVKPPQKAIKNKPLFFFFFSFFSFIYIYICIYLIIIKTLPCYHKLFKKN